MKKYNVGDIVKYKGMEYKIIKNNNCKDCELHKCNCYSDYSKLFYICESFDEYNHGISFKLVGENDGTGMKITMKPNATEKQIELAKRFYPNAKIIRRQEEE